ncbi:MAG: CinA family nicotinamide mononucleotide deamidase-related protein [Deltaproteobacteria bacterium]|nr:CinA family nicotinamide mononucleotide deamidase-related protein [Deltaproteobacteria bacterium]
MARVVIVSQGDEVISGQVVDTNAAWLSARVQAAGHTVVCRVTARDDEAEIAAVLRRAGEWGEVVLCSGGLGPTTDDLTASAVGAAFSLPMGLAPEALEALEQVAARRGRPLSSLAQRMALWPAGARLLRNPVGVAPGFTLEREGTLYAFLPGVPSEMRAMYDQELHQRLVARGEGPSRLVVIETTGGWESKVQERLTDAPLEGMSLHYRAKIGGVQVKLRGPASMPTEQVERVAGGVVERLGPWVYAWTLRDEPLPSLAQVVGDRLRERGERLAVAESCTGGQLAGRCTAVPGASWWFSEGMITYSNAAKTRQLGVPDALIAGHGAVSGEVAEAMASGAREAAGASWGLATTGVAGPDGGTPACPVGTVWIAVAGPEGARSRRLTLSGTREEIQQIASAAALDLLRRAL